MKDYFKTATTSNLSKCGTHRLIQMFSHTFPKELTKIVRTATERSGNLLILRFGTQIYFNKKLLCSVFFFNLSKK